MFHGFFDIVNILLLIKLAYFRGDWNDVSAKPTSLNLTDTLAKMYTLLEL